MSQNVGCVRRTYENEKLLLDDRMNQQVNISLQQLL